MPKNQNTFWLSCKLEDLKYLQFSEHFYDKNIMTRFGTYLQKIK